MLWLYTFAFCTLMLMNSWWCRPLKIPYIMKVSRQKSLVASCTHRSLQKFCGTPHTFSLIQGIYCMNGVILNFHIKKFRGHAKSTKTVKLFCLKTFMVSGKLCTLWKYEFQCEQVLFWWTSEMGSYKTWTGLWTGFWTWWITIQNYELTCDSRVYHTFACPCFISTVIALQW